MAEAAWDDDEFELTPLRIDDSEEAFRPAAAIAHEEDDGDDDGDDMLVLLVDRRSRGAGRRDASAGWGAADSLRKCKMCSRQSSGRLSNPTRALSDDTM